MSGLFDHLTTDQLRLLVADGAIADVYRRKVRAELDRRPDEAAAIAAVGRGMPRKVEIRMTALVRPGAWELRIRPEPPSGNAIKRVLYGEQKHEYKRYLRRLTAGLELYRGECRFDRPVRVEQFWRVAQPRDEDSFGLSLKPVLDAMQAAGLLLDDDLVRLERPVQTPGRKGLAAERGLTLLLVPCDE